MREKECGAPFVLQNRPSNYRPCHAYHQSGIMRSIDLHLWDSQVEEEKALLMWWRPLCLYKRPYIIMLYIIYALPAIRCLGSAMATTYGSTQRERFDGTPN